MTHGTMNVRNVEYFNCLGRRLTSGARCTGTLSAGLTSCKEQWGRKSWIFPFTIRLEETGTICTVLELGNSGDQIRNTRNVLKCGNGESWRPFCIAQWSLYVPYSGHYMYRTVVTICTVQFSLYVPCSGHYMYRAVVTICTVQWSLYVPPV
jgi:hypothetical protein